MKMLAAAAVGGVAGALATIGVGNPAGLIGSAHAQSEAQCVFTAMNYQQVSPYIERKLGEGYRLMSMTQNEHVGDRDFFALLCK